MSKEENTIEQNQLEEGRKQIIEQLDEFYQTCQDSVAESARICRQRENEIKQLCDEIDNLKRKKSAIDVLDGIGRQLARLYNSVYSMPQDNEYKQTLTSCLDGLTSEFENVGVRVVYELKQPAKNRSELEVVSCIPVQDKGLDNKRKCDKIGFVVDGTDVIKEQLVEFKYEQNKTTVATPIKSDSEDAKYPYVQGLDFEIFYPHPKQCAILVIKDSKLDEDFRNMNGEKSISDDFVCFNKPYSGNQTYKQYSFANYFLRMEKDSIYLYLYDKYMRMIARIALAKIKK